MLSEVQDSEEGVWVALFSVTFHCRAESWCCEDQIGKRGEVEELVVDVKELAEECLQAVEIDLGVGVEPFKVDVEDAGIL